MMDDRGISLEGNKCAQVFQNKGYFFHVYHMGLKKKAEDAFILFCQESVVPEKFTFDGPKKQLMKDTEFMKQVWQHNINYRIF